MGTDEKSVGTTTEFKPFIPASESPHEFTILPLIVGSALGLVFAASSLYLVLKVGMTVSASIPVAVLAITLFRGFSKITGLRKATILENNIVQTAGSAGESIAFGVGVTMPALLLLGFGMDLTRVMIVSVLGGILGILAMIPLRRAFIVKMHGRPGQPGTLLYPEGTACAQVLISGEKGGATGMTVFAGFGLAFAHKFVTEGMNILMTTVKAPIGFINKAAVFASDMASELLGVGYIIGFRTSAIMMAGAVLGYLVIIPVIYFVGEHVDKVVPPGTKPISQMSVKEIRDNYLLYIGAGCVASAGIISMFKTLPMIIRGVIGGLTGMRGDKSNEAPAQVRRTDDDMSMKVVLFGSIGLVVLLALFLAGEVGLTSAILGALLVVIFGFLFVTVSARLTGEIGSSSNPISGMTTATLMITCLIFLMMGMTSSKERVLALSIAAVVCIASSNGGTVAQSLKTGYLVGGTPKYMQYAILIGTIVSALVIGGTLIYALNNPGTVYSAKAENLPDLTLTKSELARLTQHETYNGVQYVIFDTRNDEAAVAKDDYVPRPEVERVAKEHPGRYLVDPGSGKLAFFKDDTIMGKLTKRDDDVPVERKFDAPKTQVLGIVINGVLKRDLNWTMVAIGGMISIMLELCGVSALAFAVGLYVPIQNSAPIFLGGIIRWAVDKYLSSTVSLERLPNESDSEFNARSEIEAIRKSETSPGVLLSSGYIAGGSIAGVLIALFAISDDLPKDLSAWQYRTVAIGRPMSLQEASEEQARRLLGSEKSSDAEAVKKLANEIADLNEDVPALWTPVSKGTTLKLPQGRTYQVEESTTLQVVAKQQLGRAYKATDLYQLNEKELKKPDKLPPEAELKLPQRTWPALTGFAALALILLIVGMGKIMKPPAENSAQTS